MKKPPASKALTDDLVAGSRTLAEHKEAMKSAIEAVKAGSVCVVDVRVLPGYDTSPGGGATAVRK